MTILKKEGDVVLSDELDFTNQVVVVSGAASGIGKATAELFASHGAKVVLADIDSESGMDVAASLTSKGFDAFFVQVDTSDVGSVNEMAAAVIRKYGKVDVLINNAGIEINDKGNILEMPAEDLLRIININLLGYIWCARALIPKMKKGGSVVNISSVQGLAAHKPGTSYQATKSGIIGLTRSLAIECGSLGIRVNAIAPGAIATEGMGKTRSGDTHIIDPHRRMIPLGRRGNSLEVGYQVLVLCSNKLSSYKTGSIDVVDGGYLANITPIDPNSKIEYSENDPDLEAE